MTHPYDPSAPPATPSEDLYASISNRVASLKWEDIYRQLNHRGFALIHSLLNRAECREVRALYTDNNLYRSHIDMKRYGFGQGEYKYFHYPLPPLVNILRRHFYTPLAGIANEWNQAMNIDTRFPPDHDEFLARCHEAGQTRPTALLLQYMKGDYNCLHQDLYGDHVFPLQVAILLSQPDVEFSGGDFVITEQRPRHQSRAHVLPLDQGDAVIFAVHHRPVEGTRGYYRVNLRHGVSEVRSGQRHTLGIIFHDAR